MSCRDRTVSPAGVSGQLSVTSKDPPGQNQAGWGTHFKIVCRVESRRVGHPPGYASPNEARVPAGTAHVPST